MGLFDVSNLLGTSTNCYKKSSKKEYKLPEGVLSFTDYCKENGINSGVMDCDLNMTNMKKARAQYNKYLQENGVNPDDLNPYGNIKSNSSSIFSFGGKVNPEELYC